MDLSPFKKQDLAEWEQLNILLAKQATWQLSTADAVRLYRALVWFDGLKAKMEKVLVDDVKVTQLTKEPEGSN